MDNIYDFLGWNKKKQQVLLLGDGFFARGFLHTIDRKKFQITQIYKDEFINPQDMMYSLQRNKTYHTGLHLKDFLMSKPEIKIKEEIKSLELVLSDKVIINNKTFNYDYLVIGLGAQKSLYDWKNQINKFTESNPESNPESQSKSIGIIGMGPIGFEIGNILSKDNKVEMFDMLPETKVLSYVSDTRKIEFLDLLNKKNILTHYEIMYDAKKYNHDEVLFCVGTRPHNLTASIKVNKFLNMENTTNIYIGGDCANTMFIKTGQVAYQQGQYVAERLNNTTEQNKEFDSEFKFKSNGMALNIGDKKVLIESHPIVPDGIYPDIIIKLYSMFCI
jgi:NADH dehydrogenase FAD-containing subunit